MDNEASDEKRFKKQHIQKPSTDEIIRSCDLEDVICDPVSSNIIRIIDEPCWNIGEEFFPHGVSVHSLSEMTENCANCREHGRPSDKCLSRFDNQIGCVWFVPTQHMAGKSVKKPMVSSCLSGSVSIDLFANFWNGQCVTIPPKTFRQIGIGHAMRRSRTDADDRKCTRPNWIAKIVSTPHQDAQGVFLGSSIIDPIQCHPARRSQEINVSLFNFSERPYAIYDKDLVGRLIFLTCHVPDYAENNSTWMRFHGMFIL